MTDALAFLTYIFIAAGNMIMVIGLGLMLGACMKVSRRKLHGWILTPSSGDVIRASQSSGASPPSRGGDGLE